MIDCHKAAKLAKINKENLVCAKFSFIFICFLVYLSDVFLKLTFCIFSGFSINPRWILSSNHAAKIGRAKLRTAHTAIIAMYDTRVFGRTANITVPINAQHKG